MQLQKSLSFIERYDHQFEYTNSNNIASISKKTTNNHMKNAPNDTNLLAFQRAEINSSGKSWQKTLQECITDVDTLFQILELPASLKPGARTASQLFPLKVPRRYLSLIEKANPHDPLLRQILPLQEEHVSAKGFTADPLQELRYMDSPGMIQKYHGRLLLTLTGTCAVNCRYCFRRQFPYSDANPGNKHWQNSLSQIRANPELSEIIFSGGDPLLVNDKKLASLLNDLSAIKHVKRLRIHSRIPIFLPERITNRLINALTSTSLSIVLVIHSNHPKELDTHVANGLAMLKNSGITLLNQSVMLKGVNDQASVLIELSERLFEMGVLPYYLHLLDRVSGTTHFDLPMDRVRCIYQEMLAALPGYLIPKLARDAPGQRNKTILAV